MSYAGLVYTGDTTDPVKAKFYGDAQGKITDASTHVLFFTLELNRIDRIGALEKAMGVQTNLARYRPWIEDLRKDKPYQLDDRLEAAVSMKNRYPGARPGTGCLMKRWLPCVSISAEKN